MIKKIYKKYEIIFNVVLFSIFPIVAFYLMEFYEHILLKKSDLWQVFLILFCLS